MFSLIMNRIFELEFPLIAQRYRACASYMFERYGIKPLYGYFWNFCANSARPQAGVDRVHCTPHVDWKNLAIGLCIIFVYGTGPLPPPL